MAGLSRRVVNLGRATAKSVPGTDDFVGGVDNLLAEANDLAALDPALEQGIESALEATSRSSASSTGTRAEQFSSRLLAGGTGARGLLARDSAATLRQRAAFDARRQIIANLGSVVQGGFRGGPAGSLVSARAQIRAAQISADTQRDLAEFDVVAALGTALLSAGGDVGAAAAGKPPVA